MTDDDDVGYRRPPRHSRFTKGKSGNPKGRPKGRRGYATDFKEELMQRIVVTEGEKRRSISKQQALFKSMVNKAIQGNPRVTLIVLRLMQDLALAYDEPEATAISPEMEIGMEFFENIARAQNCTVEEDNEKGPNDVSEA